MREPLEEIADASRRTRLPSERTYLAWWRTGLTAFAVSFGAGRLVPELSSGAKWLERALAPGEYARLENGAVAAPAVAGALLGLATVVLVVHPG